MYIYFIYIYIYSHIFLDSIHLSPGGPGCPAVQEHRATEHESQLLIINRRPLKRSEQAVPRQKCVLGK